MAAPLGLTAVRPTAVFQRAERSVAGKLLVH